MNPPNPLRPFECYYDTTRKNYMVQDHDGNWIDQTEQALQRRFRAHGFSSRRDDSGVSPIDRALLHIQDDYTVVYTGALAGHVRGLCYEGGSKQLITSEPRLITPNKGDWTMLDKVFTGLLTAPNEPDQRPYLYGWLKVSYEAISTNTRRDGQALVIAGKGNCGKSLLQKLITEILGGRSAKPYRYMMGQTPFNRDLFGAEHLMIEDEAASTDIRTRRAFGSKIKELTVNEVQSCHGKHRDGLSLRPIWRLSITLNDEPENLMILPPLDESLVDKMILLRGHYQPMPMPTQSMEDRTAFWLRLYSELPAFIHYIVHEWQIPPELRSERFGITHYHHPDILSAIDSLSPETRFLNLIDTIILSADRPEWTGTSEALEREMIENPSYNHATKALFAWSGACGTYLGRIRNKKPDRVQKISETPLNLWRIVLRKPEASTTAPVG